MESNHDSGIQRPSSDDASDATAEKTPLASDADTTNVHDGPRGTSKVGHVDYVEQALADALTKAAGAGEWAIVAQLARELEARRTAHASPSVVDFETERRKRGQP